jgi:phosphopantetheinyl transferase (holo-ACP synthase)
VSMKEIEIVPNEAGVPEVTLHGDTTAAKGISTIDLSLSHSNVSFTSRLLEELF